jgi:osmoprotectant transport system permease protein
VKRGGRGVVYLFLLLAVAVPGDASSSQEGVIRVGSKSFGESYLLAELAAQRLESEGFRVERKTGLGGTLIAFEALEHGAIDLYPEYTGTLSRVILKQPALSGRPLEVALAQRGLQLVAPFGFNNGYAIAVPEQLARELSLEGISDLAAYPDLRAAFSLEFLNREDGWPALQAHYGLPQLASGIEHALAYPALDSGRLDITDAYTTDGQLETFSLRLLRDDRRFFPAYDALLLARTDLPPAAVHALSRLGGIIDDVTMRRLNRRVSEEQLSPARVAAEFLAARALAGNAGDPGASTAAAAGPGSRTILRNTLTHLKLTGIALGLACLVALPAALLLYRRPRIARGLLYATGLVQTVPSLALLALLIPLVGLGQLPAVIALFLYSLLPVVRNTLAGLFGVDPLLKQVATGMGLTPSQQLLRVELPLAMPMILAGIRTAAVISIGTATLAAFVGAGGLGEPIITGLTLNDHRLILAGAVPAVLLALAVELAFEALERVLIPRHLSA